MKKEIYFWKVVYIFLLTMVSLHIFVLNLEIQTPSFFAIENEVYKFNLTFWSALDGLHSTWIVLGIFIFYFYYHTYFIEKKFKRREVFLSILAMIISVVILVLKSFDYYNNLDMIFSSSVQLFKCFLVGMGYYFMIYAILKWLFSFGMRFFRGEKL